MEAKDQVRLQEIDLLLRYYHLTKEEGLRKAIQERLNELLDIKVEKE